LQQHAQSMEKLGGVMDAISKSHEAIAQHIAKPKTIKLGGIKRGPDGSISGASATAH
jgi:hypothetical protein